MASIINYVADGSTNQFQIPFTYINQADVVVTVNGATPTFTFLNSTTINIAATPASGAKIIIKRVTPLNALVDFTDGSTLFEADLDLAHQQNRLIAEESRDRADSAIATINANIDDVNTVAGIASNVTTVADNTANVNSVANNMAEVLTADDNAATATTKAAEASTSAATATAQATTSTTKATESASSAAASLASKNAAATSENNAATSETNAANSATASANSASASSSSATSASGSATTATTKASEALTSANNAATSATNSANSATTATTKASEASASQSAAATSETNALSSKNAAATSATNSATSETNAATSETNAAASASTATTKASEASTSAATATTKATESATSATASANSATASANSASTATTKASEASSSAASALSHKNDAQTAKTAAETAETNAETAETNASASATAASNSASSASTSASTATTKASEASTSAATATTKASEAATSASNASTSASTATTKASEASTSATNAATSASSAQASKDAALAALDSFDDRYLGQKANNPTVDNDGDALVAGALYFNTTDDTMKVYEGSSWVAAYASLSGSVLQSNNLSDLTSASDARANLGLGTAATTAATAYATSAQGTTADNALPKSGGAMTGAITTNSTFDGVDVGQLKTDFDNLSTDIVSDTSPQLGGALDVNGHSISFGDNEKARFGNADDLQIYHDGSDSYIDDAGAGALAIRSNSINLQKYTGEAMAVFTADGAVELKYDNSTKLATQTGGISVSGNVAVSGTVDGRDVASDGNKLDGIESNAKNDQTITAGSGLSGGGTGDVTLSHADTSSVANANNSGNTFIQDINFDTYGHVTSVGTGTVSVGNGTLTVQGTGALGGSGTFTANQSGNATISISHDDTSSQGSSNNSGRTYIQDVILDGYGHVTGLSTATETVVNTNTTYTVGDGGLTQKNFTSTLKNKLDGIATSANNYSHPTGAGNKHIPSGGSSGQILQYSSSGTAVWATPSSPDPFPAAPTWTSPDATYTSSGSWSKSGSIGDGDWVIFHLISGGGSGNAGGSGFGGKGGALVLAIKGAHVPSSISFVIGAGGGYNGYGGFANAGQPSTITISGKTFTSGAGGGASYYNNSGGHGDGVLAWPGGSSPATIITVDDVRGGGSLGGGTSNAGNAGSGGYYGAGGNGALRIHW